MPLIESVPNVSEGRRREVVEALAQAIRSTPGVWLLDYSCDRSHNRSVFTVVGAAAPLKDAIVALYTHAVELIDLRQHSGQHPRVGAVDVVPFVPLEGYDHGGVRRAHTGPSRYRRRSVWDPGVPLRRCRDETVETEPGGDPPRGIRGTGAEDEARGLAPRLRAGDAAPLGGRVGDRRASPSGCVQHQPRDRRPRSRPAESPPSSAPAAAACPS